MKLFYIACTAALLLQFIALVVGCSCSSCKCQCNKDPPLKLIFQVVAHFKEVHGCDRKFNTSQSVSSDGVRYINYRTEIRKNESAIELCNCIHSYLGQKDWLDGSTMSCCIRKNIVTMTLEGEPDPTFNNSKQMQNPLEQLERTFFQFPYGEYDSHSCRLNAREDENDKIHFYVECDLRKSSPCKDDMCKGVARYLNQDNWLGELAYTCEIKHHVVYMEIMSKGQ